MAIAAFVLLASRMWVADPLFADDPVRMADGSADPGSSPDDSSAVASVVLRYQRAMTEGDSATALSLLADDVIVLENGALESREEYRSHHLASDIAFARDVRSERGPVRVATRGDVAWASSTSTSRGTFRERPVNSVSAELMVLSREPGGWKIRAIHWSSRSRQPAR